MKTAPPMSKLQKLENSWNSNVHLPHDMKRMQQMSQDIRHFILRSYVDPVEKQRIIEQAQRERRASLDTVDKIYATIGFKHHEGSDKAMELKLMKIVMMREGLLMSLSYLADKALKSSVLSGDRLLELLAQIRESTLNYLEALILWRNSSQQHQQMQMPRPFMWEGRNYTLKVIHDLDFLSENNMVTDALSLSPEQLYLNPLMLNNNLEDFNTWMEPYDRAAMDTDGRTEGSAFETRLRLRFAERILLQEMETSDDGSDIFLTQQQVQMQQPEQHIASSSSGYGQQLQVGSSALESEYEQDFEQQHQQHSQGSNRAKSSDSMNSNRATEFYSRGSNSSFGLSSAPASSHPLPHPLSHPHPHQQHHQQHQQQPFEYGHDFFTGHWADSRAEQGYMQHGQGGGQGVAEQGSVLFLENGEAIYEDEQQQEQQHEEQLLYRDDDEVSVSRSVDSVGELDLQALRTMLLPPPKCLLLAASTCVLLLGGSKEVPVPNDVSWKAFLRLLRRIDLSAAMAKLDPLAVPKFKIIAVQPIVRQLMDEDLLDALHPLGLSVATHSAVLKLVKWVQQFTQSAIRKQLKDLPKSKGKAKGKGKVALSPLKQRPGQPKEVKEKEGKFAIPKVKLDLQPYHTELLEGVLPTPLLLVLLTSAGSVEGSSASLPLRNESSACASASSEQSLRLVLKVYDVANNKEAVVHVNMREYMLLQDELCQKYTEKARHHFQPCSAQWWAAHVKQLISVQLRSNGSLHASISKKIIDDLVFRSISNASRASTIDHAAMAMAVSRSGESRERGPATPSPAPSKARHSLSAKLVSSSLNKLPPLAKDQQTGDKVSQSSKPTRQSIDNALLSSSQPSAPLPAPLPVLDSRKSSSDSFTLEQAASEAEHMLHELVDKQYELEDKLQDELVEDKRSELLVVDNQYEPEQEDKQHEDKQHDEHVADKQYELDFDAPSTHAPSTAAASESGYGDDFEPTASNEQQPELQAQAQAQAPAQAQETDEDINDWIQDDMSEQAQFHALSSSFSTNMLSAPGSFRANRPSSSPSLRQLAEDFSDVEPLDNLSSPLQHPKP